MQSRSHIVFVYVIVILSILLFPSVHAKGGGVASGAAAGGGVSGFGNPKDFGTKESQKVHWFSLTTAGLTTGGVLAAILFSIFYLDSPKQRLKKIEAQYEEQRIQLMMDRGGFVIESSLFDPIKRKMPPSGDWKNNITGRLYQLKVEQDGSIRGRTILKGEPSRKLRGYWKTVAGHTHVIWMERRDKYVKFSNMRYSRRETGEFMKGEWKNSDGDRGKSTLHPSFIL